jgi:TAT (twin-arginine translocation) pathway signal sequence
MLLVTEIGCGWLPHSGTEATVTKELSRVLSTGYKPFNKEEAQAMLRQRNSVQIRTDALKMALQKAKAGCHSCVQSYFELAKKHGATEDDISRAIEIAVESGEKGISRRDLLKIAAAVVAGVTLGSSELLPQRAEAASYYWGTDSNSATLLDIPQNFYIGRFGYGTTASTQFFNTGAALTAGKSNTYIFWGLEGSGLAPSGITSYSWGWQQASAALDQWSNNPNAALVGGHTIFADIEAGFGGWTAGNSGCSSNRQVVQGFLDRIAAAFTTTTPFRPGIYITPRDWRNYFGRAFSPSKSFVLWISICYSCDSSICAPCNDQCGNTPTAIANLLPTVKSTILGGSRVVLWQYWLDPPCGCGDFDVAIQNPALGFTPIESWTTYYSVC